MFARSLHLFFYTRDLLETVIRQSDRQVLIQKIERKTEKKYKFKVKINEIAFTSKTSFVS